MRRSSNNPTHEEAKVAIATQKLVEPEELASNIDGIAKAMRLLLGSRLKMETIVLLVSEMSGVGKKDVKNVLHCAANLDEEYLKPGKR